MTSNYESIYSLFLELIKDYDFLVLSDTEAYEKMGKWLRTTYNKPKIRKLFSSISLHDEIMTVTYELRNSVDESYDKDFVENLLANGMVVQWIENKMNKSTSIDQYFGNSEKKFYSQAAHNEAVQELYNKCHAILDKDFIRDHSYGVFAMNGKTIS